MLPLADAAANMLSMMNSKHELRIIVWDASLPWSEGQVDAMVSAQPLNLEKQTTDTHWLARGAARFNWRMAWPIVLPAGNASPSVVIVVWDQDLMGSDRLLGGATVGITELCVSMGFARILILCVPSGLSCHSIARPSNIGFLPK